MHVPIELIHTPTPVSSLIILLQPSPCTPTTTTFPSHLLLYKNPFYVVERGVSVDRLEWRILYIFLIRGRGLWLASSYFIFVFLYRLTWLNVQCFKVLLASLFYRKYRPPCVVQRAWLCLRGCPKTRTPECIHTQISKMVRLPSGEGISQPAKRLQCIYQIPNAILAILTKNGVENLTFLGPSSSKSLPKRDKSALLIFR